MLGSIGRSPAHETVTKGALIYGLALCTVVRNTPIDSIQPLRYIQELMVYDDQFITLTTSADERVPGLILGIE